jgi:hypothetical protein
MAGRARPAAIIATVIRATAAGLLLAIAGCGGEPDRIDTAKVERGIADGVEREHPEVEVTSVDCPADVRLEKGHSFKCRVRTTRGEEVEATVTQVDDRGRVRYVIP